MVRRTWWALAMIGCAGDPPECSDGFELGEGDLCYEVVSGTGTPTGTTTDPDAIEAWLGGLEDCGLPPGDGTLDLADGCLGAACVGMSFDAANAALGGDATCVPFVYEFAGYSFAYVDCLWSNGVSALLEDADRDGAADVGVTLNGLQAEAPFAGTTADGLGLGVSLTCFVPILGEPDSIALEPDDRGDWRLTTATWNLAGVTAYDSGGGGPYDIDPDGEVDSLSVYGPAF